MAAANSVLFSWADIEQRPELKRLQRVLEALPDGDMLDALEARRGHGRDNDPVAAMWRASSPRTSPRNRRCMNCSAIRPCSYSADFRRFPGRARRSRWCRRRTDRR